MKRIISIFLLLSIFLIAGCPDKNDKSDTNKTEVKSDKLDKKSAEEFLNNYMFHAMQRDLNAMLSYYSPKLRENYKPLPKQEEPRPVAYKIEKEGFEEEEFTVHIFSSYAKFPYFSEDVFKYKVITKDSKLMIDEIKKEKSTEYFAKGSILYKKEDEKSKAEALVSIEDLPNFTSAQNMLTPEQKFKVPKKRFGPCGSSPEGDTIIISSIDKDSFLGMLKLEEETFKVAQGGQQDQQEGQAAQQPQQGEEQEEGKREIKIKSIDYFLGKVVNLIVFSPDGKKFLVEVEDEKGKREIKAYNSEDGSSIDMPLNSQFKGDVFNIRDPFFISEKEFVFSVDVKANATDEEKRLKGDWIFDIENKKFRQIKQF
ncbi:MAG: hypothetical protein N2486_00290 [Caloramator sp.]|nr:hypothetical protein [Caloramator sp.]